RRKDLYRPPSDDAIPPLPPKHADASLHAANEPAVDIPVEYRRAEDFTIFFSAPDKAVLAEFNDILKILNRTYTAEIKGHIANGIPTVSIAFEDNEPDVAKFTQLIGTGDSLVKNAKFKIRVYELQRRFATSCARLAESKSMTMGSGYHTTEAQKMIGC
ncbi:MAG: hypothetical protein ACYDCK_11385, partial [Thermoplasmatota archaeon]